MKKSFRFIALAMALVIALFAFAACGTDAGTETPAADDPYRFPARPDMIIVLICCFCHFYKYPYCVTPRYSSNRTPFACIAVAASTPT